MTTYDSEKLALTRKLPPVLRKVPPSGTLACQEQTPAKSFNPHRRSPATFVDAWA
jgi:hypothetical protein